MEGRREASFTIRAAACLGRTKDTAPLNVEAAENRVLLTDHRTLQRVTGGADTDRQKADTRSL